MNALLDRIIQAEQLVALTGAGVSTLSGIPDFRSPDGLYNTLDAEKLFDVDYFRRDPAYYYRHARDLIYSMHAVEPSIVHTELARWEAAGLLKGVITQNIDMLHRKAGSRRIHEIHGTPEAHTCLDCGEKYEYTAVLALLEEAAIPRCRFCGGVIKPDITFFGEMLPENAITDAFAAAERADLMLVLGTSLTVYPAASLPMATLRAGGEVIIVNSQPTPCDTLAIDRYPDLERFFSAARERLRFRAG